MKTPVSVAQPAMAGFEVSIDGRFSGVHRGTSTNPFQKRSFTPFRHGNRDHLRKGIETASSVPDLMSNLSILLVHEPRSITDEDLGNVVNCNAAVDVHSVNLTE